MPSAQAVSMRGTGSSARQHPGRPWSSLWIGLAAFACTLAWHALLAVPGEKSTPPGEESARRDIYGDSLPSGAVCRLGTVRFRHPDKVTCVCFSPDGKTLASGGQDSVVRIWDVRTGRQIRQYDCTGDPSATRALCFSPDGNRLAMDRTFDILCVDLRTGKEMRWRGHKIWVCTVAFSPDGRRAASRSADGTILLWDATIGKVLWVLEGNAEGILGRIAFSPDGTMVISAQVEKNTRIWDVTTGALLRKIDWERPKAGTDPFRGTISCVTFSPDGKSLVIGVSETDGEAHLYLCSVDSGKVLRRFSSFDRVVKVAAFSPDGAILAAGGWHHDGAIILWDVASGRRLRQFSSETPTSISFSPDGCTLASCCDDPAIHLWDVATGKERDRSPQHLDDITRVAFTPDGQTVGTVSADWSLRLWDAGTGRQRLMLQKNPASRYPGGNLFFQPGDRTLVCLNELHALSVVEVATGREVRKMFFPELEMETFAASPDGKRLAVRTYRRRDGERRILLLDASSGKELHRLPDPMNLADSNPFLCGPLLFSPDGKVLASALCNSTIRLWDPATGKELRRLQRNGARVYGVTFSPDGKLLASTTGGGDAGSIIINELWEVATGKNLSVAEEGAAPYWSGFAPDGRTFFDTDQAGNLRTYESASGKALLRFAQPGSSWTDAAFSPDGQRLASGHSHGTAYIWDLAPQGWQAPTSRATPEQLAQFWADVGGEYAPRAHRAIFNLAHHGAPALAFLCERLKPVPKDFAERLRQRIADLDHDDFRTRESAMRELTRLGPDAVLPLHAALDAKPSVEARNRIEALLKDLHPWYIKDPETLRTVRAIWALQLMATPEARAVLDTLAAGAPEARITQEAQAALRFLDRNRKP
jgi:WD40 repeat protein